ETSRRTFISKSRISLFRMSLISARSRSVSVSPLASKRSRSEEHTSELQSRENLVCRLLLEKKKKQPGLKKQIEPLVRVHAGGFDQVSGVQGRQQIEELANVRVGLHA